MEIEALIRGVFFILVLLFVMFLYHIIILKLAETATRKIWFGLGAFAIFNILYLGSDILKFISSNPETLEDIINLIELFWWLSLNYLVNQLIHFWIWNRLFLQQGIMVSRVLKDMVSMILIILTIAAIVHFVYEKSVMGIFTASGVMAIILGYSAQALLSDVFAGLGLNTSKQFNEGDWIKVGDFLGKIEELNWRFVKVMTPDQNNLYLPNSFVTKLPITNFSMPDKARGVSLQVYLYDNTPPEQFKQILITAARQSTKVLSDPCPSAALYSLYNNQGVLPSLVFTLSYFTKEMSHEIVNDEIQSILWYMARRKGIKVQQADIAPPPELSLAAIEAFLKTSALFAGLTSDELQLLTSGAIVNHYGPPERILNQGQSNTSLFLIYDGSVDVYFTQNVEKPTYIATLEKNAYFGEMSLLTGELCSASILVKTESIIIEITHENISTLFTHHPHLVEQISEIVVRRKLENEKLRAAMNKNETVDENTLVARMVLRVKQFFHM